MSREISTSIAVVAAAILIGLIVSWVARSGVRRLLTADVDPLDERRQRVATIWSVIRRLIWLVLLIVVVWTLGIIWDIPATPFVAVGSAIGVALGFGAQDLVKDVIAGFFILSEDQFHVGDVVRIGGVSGAVEDVRLRVTVLRDLEGVVHYVPNGSIEVASNLTQEFSRVVIDIPVAYQSPLDEVIELLADEMALLYADEEWGSRMTEEPQMLGVERLGESSVDIRIVLTAVPVYRWDVKREALRRVKSRLDRDGIEIPFPQRTIWQRVAE